jgi:hypothetical protein
MSCFSTQTATGKFEPDTSKHVNYTLGMVLGVDDFKQEFAYLSGRDQWIARDLIGYGTVRGLCVKTETDATEGPRVMVAPGVAISPQGQKICVPTAQCCALNSWLKANEAKVREKVVGTINSPISSPISSPPSSGLSVKVYVKLCYRECLTDNVLIPGEPCRSEENLSQPSRIMDDFHLKLCLETPKQIEEEAVRDFVDWLKRVKVTNAQGASTPLKDFLKAIRDAVDKSFSSPIYSPLSPPDFMLGSPPPSLHIHPDDACKYLRAAFRLWATELRPRWIERWHGCGATAPNKGANDTAEECVMLAELEVPLLPASPGGFIVNDVAEIKVNEERRPFVLHLRALQEWLLCRVDEVGILSPPISSPPSGGGVTDHGALTGLGDDDHTQYLLANGTRALSGNLSAGGNRITNLGAGTAAGEAIIFQQAAVGDLSGAYPNPKVAALQGRPVIDSQPNLNDALMWNGNAWQARQVVFPNILPFASVRFLDNNIYFVWFNLDVPDNNVLVTTFTQDAVVVQAESINQAEAFLTPVPVTQVAAQPNTRNQFRISLQPPQPNQPEPDFLRFRFDLARIQVTEGQNQPQTLLAHGNATNKRFVGFDGKRFVTVFVRRR